MSDETCCICYESDTGPLECGHLVHLSCVQKSADAMQEIRQLEGFPPLQHGECPLCRCKINVKPKQIVIPEEIIFTRETFLEIYSNREFEIPLVMQIWIHLCEKYPANDPQHLIRVAQHFEDQMLYMLQNE